MSAFIGTAPEPARQAFTITKSDVTVFSPPTSGIWVGGAGTVVAILAGDTVAVTFAGLVAGTLLPVSASQVMAATTATLLVGLR